jgi:hypothetical protein
VLKVDVNLYGSTTSMYRVDECLSHNHFLHNVTVDVKPADGRNYVFLHIYRKYGVAGFMLAESSIS